VECLIGEERQGVPGITNKAYFSTAQISHSTNIVLLKLYYVIYIYNRIIKYNLSHKTSMLGSCVDGYRIYSYTSQYICVACNRKCVILLLLLLLLAFEDEADYTKFVKYNS
jgi:hypothetical protein